MALHQRARVAGVGLDVQHARGVRVQHRIARHLLEVGHADHGARAVERGGRAAPRSGISALGAPRGARGDAQAAPPRRRSPAPLSAPRRVRIGAAAPTGARRRRRSRESISVQPAGSAGGARKAVPRTSVMVVGRLARPQAVRDLDDGALGVAVDQQVGARVDQDRAADLVRPVVVVGDAAQAGLDAADHDGDVAERLAAALRVDDHRAIGPLAAAPPGRIRVVGAQPPVGRVAVHHRVHVARR